MVAGLAQTQKKSHNLGVVLVRSSAVRIAINSLTSRVEGGIKIHARAKKLKRGFFSIPSAPSSPTPSDTPISTLSLVRRSIIGESTVFRRSRALLPYFRRLQGKVFQSRDSTTAVRTMARDEGNERGRRGSLMPFCIGVPVIAHLIVA